MSAETPPNTPPNAPKDRNRRVRTALPMVWHATFHSTVRNVSRGGLLFETQSPPAVGTEIQLRFPLPGETQEISVKGTIRWVSTQAPGGQAPALWGVGLEFKDLDADSRQRLDTFVDKSGSERRLGNRLNVRLVVEYLFAGENYRTVANELSMRGLFLVTDEPHQLEDVLHLKFRLPDLHALIKARGLVRWRHASIPETLSGIVTPGMGIEFTDISDDDLQLIMQFIQNQR